MVRDLLTGEVRHGREAVRGVSRPSDARKWDGATGRFPRAHYPPLPPVLAWFVRTRPRNVNTRTLGGILTPADVRAPNLSEMEAGLLARYGALSPQSRQNLDAVMAGLLARDWEQEQAGPAGS